MESLANQDLGLSAFNFTYSSYIWALVSFRHQSKTNTNRCKRVKEQLPCSTHKLKYGNRMKDWQIPNKFVTLSNNASLLMIRDKSCRQSNEASCRHPTSQSKTGVCHGHQTESLCHCSYGRWGIQLSVV